MPVIQLPSKSLCGLSFSIPDLILLRGWAEARGFRMTVHLDHGVEWEEYEEVVALSDGESSLCRWIIWRNARTVFVQPLIGRPRRYRSVADAIHTLTAKSHEVLTDIDAKYWPR